MLEESEELALINKKRTKWQGSFVTVCVWM